MEHWARDYFELVNKLALRKAIREQGRPPPLV
jgi:hypothetical protein